MLIKDSISPFFGVVEENDDPEMVDRYQVRCYGYHTDKKSFIPTNFLPWMYSVGEGAGVSGIGPSSSRYVKGTTVFGFFVDKELQTGVILGSLKGKPTKKLMTNMGFADPDGVYPFYTNESDVNRLARHENIDKTIVDWKIRTRVEGVPKVDGESWDEPYNQYGAEYPNNHVFETESGHVVEYDDTPGAERISINHKSGTYQEIQQDGTKIEKVVNDSFNIFLGGSFVFVNGNLNQFVGGDVDLNITGNLRIKAESVEIDSDLKVYGKSEATDHVSSGVSGADHIHEQKPDSRGDAQLPTEPPMDKGDGFEKSDVDSFSPNTAPYDPDIRKEEVSSSSSTPSSNQSVKWPSNVSQSAPIDIGKGESNKMIEIPGSGVISSEFTSSVVGDYGSFIFEAEAQTGYPTTRYWISTTPGGSPISEKADKKDAFIYSMLWIVGEERGAKVVLEPNKKYYFNMQHSPSRSAPSKVYRFIR